MIARRFVGGLLLAVAACSVGAQTLSVQVDNDEFAGLNRHDRWYSQSLRAHWFRPALADGPVTRMADAWCALQACDAGAMRSARWSIGQTIFMQNQRRLAAHDPLDRPMAGWLFASAASLVESRDQTRLAELQVGVTGPASLAEWVQTRWHRDVLHVDPALGWEHQLRPRLGVQWQLAHEQRWPLLGQHLDLVGRAGGTLGTLQGHALAALSLRVGDRLAGTAMPLEASAATGRIGTGGRWSVQAGGALRLVGWDRFIDGSLYGAASRARPAPWVAEAHLGATVAPAPGWQLRFALVRRTMEFDSEAVAQGRFKPQTFGTLQASVDWR
ncbi:MAG: lipid A deacylase LpxR family protein [Burkholderiales bacterium]